MKITPTESLYYTKIHTNLSQTHNPRGADEIIKYEVPNEAMKKWRREGEDKSSAEEEAEGERG